MWLYVELVFGHAYQQALAVAGTTFEGLLVTLTYHDHQLPVIYVNATAAGASFFQHCSGSPWSRAAYLTRCTVAWVLPMGHPA